MKYFYVFIGFFICLHFVGLIQDIMGKEKYIKSCQENWQDSKETKPLHMLSLIVLIITLLFI